MALKSIEWRLNCFAFRLYTVTFLSDENAAFKQIVRL